MNRLHGIIFVVDANQYNDTTYDNISYCDLRSIPIFDNFGWESTMFSDQVQHERDIIKQFAKSKLFVHEVIQSVLSYKQAFEIPVLIYANKQDLPNASQMKDIQSNLVTSRNLANLKNTLLYGMPTDIINLIVEYMPGITDDALARPLKVFNAIATATIKDVSAYRMFQDKKKSNHIEKGFQWLIKNLKIV